MIQPSDVRRKKKEGKKKKPTDTFPLFHVLGNVGMNMNKEGKKGRGNDCLIKSLLIHLEGEGRKRGKEKVKKKVAMEGKKEVGNTFLFFKDKEKKERGGKREICTGKTSPRKKKGRKEKTVRQLSLFSWKGREKKEVTRGMARKRRRHRAFFLPLEKKGRGWEGRKEGKTSHYPNPLHNWGRGGHGFHRGGGCIFPVCK